MTIGANIQARRALLRMKQETLADRVGVKRPYLSRVERGHTIPSVTMLQRIAAALETTVGELAGERTGSRDKRLLVEAVRRYQAQVKELKSKLRSIQKTAKA